MATPGKGTNSLAAVLVFVAVGVTIGAGLIGWAIGQATESEAAATETVTVTAPAATEAVAEEERRRPSRQAPGRRTWTPAAAPATV